MKPKSFAKLLVFINALVPLAVLIYDKSTNRLGADPANYLLQTTGLLALLFLIFSLAITPMRRLTGQNYYSLFRRMLGLYGFFYACCHLLIFIFVFKAGVFANVLAALRAAAERPIRVARLSSASTSLRTSDPLRTSADSAIGYVVTASALSCSDS